MAPVTPMASNFLVPNGTFWVELAAFVVMFLILRRYVIPPINKAMEARQDAIRQEFAEAEAFEAKWHEEDKERFHQERLP